MHLLPFGFRCRPRWAALVSAAGLMACGAPPPPDETATDPDRRDHHSYANPEAVRVTHVELDLEVSFADRALRGSAMLSLERVEPDAASLVLDTRDLQIDGVEAWSPSGGFEATTYLVGDADPILGAPLRIELPPAATRVRVTYRTSSEASALQWLDAGQTAGGQHPFLFTQSQAIHARSWIPLQDSPGVRVTYGARIQTPPGLRAVMSAANDPEAPADGDYRLDMRQPIPSYLIALAVGDLAFAPLGPRAGSTPSRRSSTRPPRSSPTRKR